MAIPILKHEYSDDERVVISRKDYDAFMQNYVAEMVMSSYNDYTVNGGRDAREVIAELKRKINGQV